MMKIFSLAIMAAVSFAATEEESSDPAETWDDMCYHCINEGNMYCVTGVQKTDNNGDSYYEFPTTEKGKCMEANCETQTDAQKKAGATCKLTQETKDLCKGDDKKLIVAFSECDKPAEIEGCDDLIISQEKIDGKGVHIEDTDPKEYQPYF